MFLLFELVRNKCVTKVYKYVTSYQLKLKKISAELANLNHCAAPFWSRAAVNLYWYYFSSGLANSHAELHSALNGNDGQRSETDFKIHSSMQRCLRECAFVAEAVRLLDTGEGPLGEFLHWASTLMILLSSLSRSTSCWVTNFSNSFYFLA